MPKQLLFGQASSSRIEFFKIVDMNGSPITGLVYNSTGLLAKYIRPGSASVVITLATQTVTGAYSSGGLVEVDATAFPGRYRFDIPDAAFASGVDKVIVSLYGYSGMAVSEGEYMVEAVNPQDAVRFGLTAIPNVASGSAGAIPTTGSGANQISVSSGQVILQTGTGTGQLDFTSGVVKSNMVQILGTALTETVGQIAAAFKKFFNIATPASTMDALTLVATATTVGSVTGNVGGSVASVTSPVSLTAGQLFIKKNVGFTLTFPMTDAITHAPKTGLTVASFRTIDGAAIGATANSVTELSAGLYNLVVANADVNGTMITFEFTAAGADTKFIGVVTQS